MTRLSTVRCLTSICTGDVLKSLTNAHPHLGKLHQGTNASGYFTSEDFFLHRVLISENKCHFQILLECELADL